MQSEFLFLSRQPCVLRSCTIEYTRFASTCRNTDTGLINYIGNFSGIDSIQGLLLEDRSQERYIPTGFAAMVKIPHIKRAIWEAV
jgi:hypothetical protein